MATHSHTPPPAGHKPHTRSSTAPDCLGALLAMLPGESATSASAIIQAMGGFNRAQLGDTIEALIGILDLSDGDPDVERNGDELDGSLGEDDFSPLNAGPLPGPGCPISDPDLAVDDDGCDDINDEREPEEHGFMLYGADQTQPLPHISGADERRLLAPHTRRIRRTRCDYDDRWGYRIYRLRTPLPLRGPKLRRCRRRKSTVD